LKLRNALKKIPDCNTDSPRRKVRLSLVPLRIHARTGSSGLSAPFCPLAFLLSLYQSGRWLVGAVGIEPNARGRHHQRLIYIASLSLARAESFGFVRQISIDEFDVVGLKMRNFLYPSGAGRANHESDVLSPFCNFVESITCPSSRPLVVRSHRPLEFVCTRVPVCVGN
jgi:hypothetical protein